VFSLFYCLAEENHFQNYLQSNKREPCIGGLSNFTYNVILHYTWIIIDGHTVWIYCFVVKKSPLCYLFIKVANTLRSSALALCYSAAEYCAPVWSRSAHTSRVDVQLNYHASHFWYPPFYTSPMASSAVQH